MLRLTRSLGVCTHRYAGDAAERSAFTGTFYALAKAVSAALQFLGVPLLFRQVPLSTILALMPTVVLLGVATLAYAPSLVTASGLLLVFKITECVPEPRTPPSPCTPRADPVPRRTA